MIISLRFQETMVVKDYILANCSRNFFGFLRKNKALLYNNKRIRLYDVVNAGEVLIIKFNNTVPLGNVSKRKLNIIYEDDFLLVVDKEPHIQTIPSTRNPYDSVFNRLLNYLNYDESIHFINRLDKETSGLVLVAKNPFVACLFEKTVVDKVYLAKTIFPLVKDNGKIDLPISRGDGIKRKVDINGQKAVTNYERIKGNLYRIKLETGRTHQIRVHLAHYGTPIVNDCLYGKNDGVLGLLCYEISFIHPVYRRRITVSSTNNMFSE